MKTFRTLENEHYFYISTSIIWTWMDIKLNGFIFDSRNNC